MTTILRLWHESDALFDAPDYEKAIAARRLTDRHANGGLGLWCTYQDNPVQHNPQSKLIFGEHMYMVIAHAQPTEIRRMALSELAFLSRRIDTSDTGRVERERMMGAGIKILSIREQDGTCQQAIIIDYSTIALFRRVERVQCN